MDLCDSVIQMFVEKTLDGMWGIKDLFYHLREVIFLITMSFNVSVFAASLLILVIVVLSNSSIL